jgi:4-amino-4-deoxy-L-arabinose transferase-like glycosyltransferase
MQTLASKFRLSNRSGFLGSSIIGLVLFLLFSAYVFGIWENPPGYYVDESALSYNAYLVSQTGAGEFGPKFPLYFQIYTGGFTQYSNPTQIYLLAILFKVFGPGILTARVFAAAWVFAASLLLGLLARRISGKNVVGLIVAAAALLTPWLFEVGRLVLETFFYPMATVLLLWSVYKASEKKAWSYLNVAAVAGSLTLLTYSYTIGRLLGPLLAGGLILFAVNRERIISVAKVWAAYALTLIPLIVYIKQNPELTTRFYLLSYIKPESSYPDIAFNFVKRFFQDINPLTMLLVGDTNPRHHLSGVFGSFFVAVFVLAVIGIVIVVLRHRRDSWWLYVLYGLLASVIPGALTVDVFHTLRMIAYPVFLLTLMVPALDWLLETKYSAAAEPPNDPVEEGEISAHPTRSGYWQTARGMVLTALLVFGSVEAAYFHWNYYKEGPKRGYVFDEGYKSLYDQAVGEPLRPIYLVDAYWGPMYIHSFWYATLEGRDTAEFVHQPYGVRPPQGAIVISTEQACTNCEMIRKNGDFLLYRTR